MHQEWIAEIFHSIWIRRRNHRSHGIFGITFKNNSGVLPTECYCHNKNQHSVSKLNIRVLIWVFYNKIKHCQGNDWYYYSDIYIMIPTIILLTVKQPSFCIFLQMFVVTQLFFPQCCVCENPIQEFAHFLVFSWILSKF